MAAIMPAPAPPAPRSSDPREAMLLHYQVEQFLFHEAELLDDRHIDRWMDLLADDIRYLMPIRTNRADRERHLEYVPQGELAYYDESKKSLHFRLLRLQSGQAWAETPPSRTRRLISNIRVAAADCGGLAVKSAFLLYRTRLERQVDIYCGERHDILRPTEGGAGFTIARRTILLDQATVLAVNFSVFF